MDVAVTQLRANGFDVRDEGVARLSPFVRHHITMHGRYSFQLPELPVACGPWVIRLRSMRSKSQPGTRPTSATGQPRRNRW
ncbi:Tn3 family transposase [Streptomyces sp. 8N706]|uniref:Tn3 family transposase n=1 Tax=Streptomyces sp. 8N706 TaxID=3457416 RepID=UPI003FD4EF19